MCTCYYAPCRDEADSSAAHMPPVRSACLPVAVEFTRLETEHLPARETREQEISSYKRKAQVHLNFMVLMILKLLCSSGIVSDTSTDSLQLTARTTQHLCNCWGNRQQTPHSIMYAGIFLYSLTSHRCALMRFWSQEQTLYTNFTWGVFV